MNPRFRPNVVVPAVLLLAVILVLSIRQTPGQESAQLAPSSQPVVASLTGLAEVPLPATVTPNVVPIKPTVTIAASRPSRSPSPTATLEPTPTLGPTVAPDLALEFTAVRPNQVLGAIAARYGVTVDDIVAFSAIEEPDLLAIGQGLIIPHRTGRSTPPQILLPDSELVYGPAYVDFDLQKFVEEQGGYLAEVTLPAPNGERWSGWDAVQRVAQRFSVGPRVLLALMEARSGWVTDPEPSGANRDYPLGHLAGAPGLLAQLEWTADELNRGFYGWLDRGETAIRFQDGVVARGAPGLNAATVAIHRVLAGDSQWSEIQAEADAFAKAYRRLFGDPAARDVGPVLPADLEQPLLRLPWAPGEWWHLTGGPHGGWGSGSGWAALDFVPETAAVGACWPAEAWARASAHGVVARSDGGELLLDLDGDGDMRTGWVLQYLHITDRADLEQALAPGDPVGRPSCEGGTAETTHLHLARRYNGLWVAADGPVPFVLDGWRAFGGFEYEGRLTKPGMPDRQASHSRDREVNGLAWTESEPRAVED